MDQVQRKQLENQLLVYLQEHKLKKTIERFQILECICDIAGHFDLKRLALQLKTRNFRVSRATMYNNIEILVDAGLVVRHTLQGKTVEYELRILANTHLHLICTLCGTMRELKNKSLEEAVKSQKITKFTPDYYALYVYGLCSKCKYKVQQMNKRKRMKKSKK